MNCERAANIIGRGIVGAATIGAGEKVADAAYAKFISPSVAYVQTLDVSQTAQFLHKDLISIAEAVDDCQVGYSLRLRHYINKNNIDGYQEGVDEVVGDDAGARVSMRVSSKDVKVIVSGKPVDYVTTDKEGRANLTVVAPCTSPDKDHSQKGISAEANIADVDGKKYTKTVWAPDSKERPYDIWLAKSAATGPAGTGGGTGGGREGSTGAISLTGLDLTGVHEALVIGGLTRVGEFLVDLPSKAVDLFVSPDVNPPWNWGINGVAWALFLFTPGRWGSAPRRNTARAVRYPFRLGRAGWQYTRDAIAARVAGNPLPTFVRPNWT